ncbi:predicted protein [Plenodomus lingam JN3]|uniref:Predicted protein n=1 Tax=Leptosphaeria maculans (strain JN3 / isolate v23.1.3 / race Av1-4-5-6-7-8) TaxID=985895 RepID=E5A863_LEPMJ|nr:predicted protein [Plenodomus lingam JN3]CBX99808.1 predicted protein [Plenodomus lingam JN3]
MGTSTDTTPPHWITQMMTKSTWVLHHPPIIEVYLIQLPEPSPTPAPGINTSPANSTCTSSPFKNGIHPALTLFPGAAVSRSRVLYV